MRILIFLSGAVIMAMGILAFNSLERHVAHGFLEGALTLGGAFVICGIFTLRMPWHGMIGAGIVALLGAGRGLGNLPGMAKFMAGDRSRGPAPILELGVTVICVFLLLRVVRALMAERTRRMLEESEAQEKKRASVE